MQKIHSHYENLKVARDAPPEVIRAAYKTLSQKYHPDRNPGDEAARVMGLINRAYEVLSDPQRRAAHDDWIRRSEEATHSIPLYDASETPSPFSKQWAETFQNDEEVRRTMIRQHPTAYLLGRAVSHVIRHWFWYGCLAIYLIWQGDH